MDEEFDVPLGPPAKKLCEDMIYLSSDSSSESSEDFLFPSDTENENAVCGLQDETVSSQQISIPEPQDKKSSEQVAVPGPNDEEKKTSPCNCTNAHQSEQNQNNKLEIRGV